MPKEFPSIPCSECGEQFPPTRDQYYNNNIGKRALCANCHGKLRKPFPDLMCAAEGCGKTFRPASNTRKRHEEGKPVYCCRPCAARYQYRKKGPRMQLNKSDGSARPVLKSFARPVTSWIPYSGVGASDFPALHNPF